MRMKPSKPYHEIFGNVLLALHRVQLPIVRRLCLPLALRSDNPGMYVDPSRALFGILIQPQQARLETSWRALFVPAKLKLDFLQKYCTLERALDLPRTAHLLEIAGKAVPLREKVRSVHDEPRYWAQQL